MHKYSLLSSDNKGIVTNSASPLPWPLFCKEYAETVEELDPDTPKEALPGLCCGTFHSNRRLASELEQISLLAIDIDSSPSDLAARLAQSDYNYLLIESPSSQSWVQAEEKTAGRPRPITWHANDDIQLVPETDDEALIEKAIQHLSLPGHPNGDPDPGDPVLIKNPLKYRLIVPLSDPINSSRRFARNYGKAIERAFPFLMDLYDPQCKDASRFMYIPNSSRLDSLVYETNKDPVPTELFAPTQEAPPPPPPDPTMAQVNHRLCHEWGLPTFQLTLNDHAPCYPLRPESDSGNHLVREEGITDFNHPTNPNGHHFTSWRVLHSIFTEIKKGTYQGQPIHQWYLDRWHEAGEPVLEDPALDLFSPIKIVESTIRGRYHWVKQHDHTSPLLPLDETQNEFDVAVEFIKDPNHLTQGQREEVAFYDSEAGRWLNRPPAVVKKDIRAVAAERNIYLGAAEKGLSYHTKENSLYESNHILRKFRPKFHKDVDTYLQSLPFKWPWLRNYLWYFPLVQQYALPWIHCFGTSGAGKTVFANILASIFSSPPVEDIFGSSNFTGGLGKSPVIFVDEEAIPKGQFFGQSAINFVKKLVTSKRTPANEKWEKQCHVLGYHRVLTAKNDTTCNLPVDDAMDTGAIVRRLQTAQFTPENKSYLDQYCPTKTLESFIDFKFGEWLAYHREVFTPHEAQSIIAVHPLPSEFFNESTLNSDRNQQIMEGIIAVVVKQADSAGYWGEDLDNYYIRINEGSLAEFLVDKKKFRTPPSINAIKELVLRCVSGSEYSRSYYKQQRSRSIRLPKTSLKSLAEGLGMDFEKEEVTVGTTERSG